MRSKALVLCGLSGVAAIDAESVAENSAALCGDAPAPCTGHFDDETAHVESLQHSADGGALAVPVAGCVAVQSDSEVFVAEALGDVIAR